MDNQNYIPRLYGRRMDKPLKPRQEKLIACLLPKVKVPEGSVGETLEPKELLPNANEFWLEIGFGGGEHLVWQAISNPHTGVIGAEPFVNGVAKLLTQIDDKKLENVRIHFGDARPLMEALPDAALTRLFVLHPDPWPKKRHHKRRIISPWFFKEASRVLAPGGILRIASDIPDYIRWTLMHMRNSRAIEWAAKSAADWTVRPDDWPQTRYEKKALAEGRRSTYLEFYRL